MISLQINQDLHNALSHLVSLKVLAHVTNNGSMSWIQIPDFTLDVNEIDNEMCQFINEVITYSITEGNENSADFYVVKNEIDNYVFEWDLDDYEHNHHIKLHYKVFHDGNNTEDENVIIDLFNIPKNHDH